MDLGEDCSAEEFDLGHDVFVVEAGLLEGEIRDADGAMCTKDDSKRMLSTRLWYPWPGQISPC